MQWWSRSSNAYTVTAWLAALVLATSVWMSDPGVAVSVTPGIPLEDRMPQSLSPHVLLGRWEKLPHAPCAHRYPDTLEFQERGLYIGHSDPPGTFTLWDTGTYEMVEPHRIRLSTANDAVLTYHVSWKHDQLIFIDPDGCEFAYRKMT